MTGTKRNNFSFSIDIQNAGNLINKDWGRVYRLGNDNFPLLNFRGLDTANEPTYTFNPTLTSTKDIFSIQDISSFNSSRWNAQIGLKYFFK